ncbi:hypothetical protein B0H11DRAFT_2099728 [Mycena galericulata]|nr:hypothetical protein B0H11DRAFT_2099728 [Mycena galericulata]
MPLPPLVRMGPSIEYATNEFASAWARVLDKEVVGAHTATRVDDIVVLGLFSRITNKPVSRRFFPALNSTTGPPIDLNLITEFRGIVNSMQGQVLRLQTHLNTLREDTRELTRRILGMGIDRLNLEGCQDVFPAMKWALRAYLTLIAPWSAVRLKVVRMGQDETLGFGVVAQRDILEGAYIHELIGLLTPDHTSEQSGRSQILCPTHHTEHIIWGPIRMLNHDCRPSVQWVQVPGQHSMVALALRNIGVSEELFVDYGRESGHCPCRTCHPVKAVASGSHAVTLPVPLPPTEEQLQRAEEKRKKEKQRRAMRYARARDRRRKKREGEE